VNDMHEIDNFIDPIEILLEHTSAKERYLHDDFIDLIKRIYQYEIFKPFLDFVVTACREKRLNFFLEVKGVLDLNEGNCKTIETRGVTNVKKYTITIWKITPDVVIHEISHMMEKETGVNLATEFVTALKTDLRNKANFSLTLEEAVKDVLITQVGAYPKNQVNSELFARIFQLFAMSKEVMGKNKSYGFSVIDIYKAFPKIQAWIWDTVYSNLIPRINESVAQTSQNYIKPIDQIAQNWANEAVPSFHVDKKDKRWSKSIKSIKD
jgi:hypothetical protein